MFRLNIQKRYFRAEKLLRNREKCPISEYYKTMELGELLHFFYEDFHLKLSQIIKI